MASLADVVVDCRCPAALARFWAAALDGYSVMPYDDHEIARLELLGLTPETDPTVMVIGPGPRLCFQEVVEDKVAKNRVHLDLRAADRDAEVARLAALGATVHQVMERWTTMLDPEGNEFCVAAD